jgi:hypothetical protein
MAKTEAEAPLRVGAKAKKLLSSVDKPQTVIEKAVKKAESLARENGDRMLRDYYLYQALGLEMPASVAADWEYFRTNGKERPGASATGNGGSSTKKASTKKAGGAATPTKPTSGKASYKPDLKPSGSRSGKRSKSTKASTSSEAPSTESETTTESASAAGSLPSSSDVLEI